MDPIRMEIIHNAARELAAAPHGQKGPIIESGRVYSPPLGAFPLRRNVSEPCCIR